MINSSKLDFKTPNSLKTQNSLLLPHLFFSFHLNDLQQIHFPVQDYRADESLSEEDNET